MKSIEHSDECETDERTVIYERMRIKAWGIFAAAYSDANGIGNAFERERK